MTRPGAWLASALLCGTALHAQNVTRLDAAAGVPDIDKTTQAQDVRFRDAAGDRMTVQVRVGGTGPYRFLVDTGADRSAVSSEIVSTFSVAGSAPALRKIDLIRACAYWRYGAVFPSNASIRSHAKM